MTEDEIVELIATAYAAAWKHDIETHLASPASAPSWDEMGCGQRAAMKRVSAAVLSALNEAGCLLGKRDEDAFSLGRLNDFVTAARSKALEEAAGKLDELLHTQTLLLMAGEMTSQEIRTVKAVLRNRAAAIRAAKPEGQP